MITYEDPEAHDDVLAPINDEWSDKINLEEPDTIIDIQSLLDEPVIAADERIVDMGRVVDDLGYKSLVEKYGLQEAERRLSEFQEKNMIVPPTTQALEVVSPGVQDMIALLARQNELIEQLMSRNSQQPQVVINNQLDPEPLAKAIRDSQPVIQLTVEPSIEFHPTIEMPKVKTETSTSTVLRDEQKRMLGAVTIHTTEYDSGEVIDNNPIKK